MATEIERKFLVDGDFVKRLSEGKVEDVISCTKIAQGYLCSVAQRTVRVRVRGKKGYLTIKGANQGAKRFEWEKEIPCEEAMELLQLCEKGVIEKERYVVRIGGHDFEIDVFHGENEGLVVAEVELQDENEDFVKPQWIVKEVTSDPRYYNSNLTKLPYSRW